MYFPQMYNTLNAYDLVQTTMIVKFPVPLKTSDDKLTLLVTICTLFSVLVMIFCCWFYPTVTTFGSLLSQIHLSSVTFVRPTQGLETFGNISLPICTLAILWPLCKILRGSSQGNPSVGGLKRKRGKRNTAMSPSGLWARDVFLVYVGQEILMQFIREQHSALCSRKPTD